jgi:hypothetical protein
MNTAESLENLAAEIGDQVYIDVAKWHLYLRDAHLHTIVADKLYDLLSNRAITEQAVTEVLQSITIKLGGGKKELPLLDLIPMQCQVSLMDLLEEFQRKL